MKTQTQNKTIDYRGFEIQIHVFQTRFGTLYEGVNNIGEPYLERTAYKTRQEAIDAAKADIDIYVNELNEL